MLEAMKHSRPASIKGCLVTASIFAAIVSACAAASFGSELKSSRITTNSSPPNRATAGGPGLDFETWESWKLGANSLRINTLSWRIIMDGTGAAKSSGTLPILHNPSKNAVTHFESIFISVLSFHGEANGRRQVRRKPQRGA
jgi:hypothetical protein